MTARLPRIFLYGHFGSGNIGNDSSLEAALYHIRKYQPEAQIICICNGPQVISERFKIPALPIRPKRAHPAEAPAGRIRSLAAKIWFRLASETSFWLNNPSAFRPGDLFLIVGTGAVDDMAVRNPWNAPYELYKWCKSARMGGARVLFLSVGVGPILNSTSRFLMLRALRMAEYRSYRENAAFEYLHGVGFDTTGDALYPDLVFSLPINLPAASEKAGRQPKVIGLGLINYYGWQYDSQRGESIFQEYMAKIKRFVAWLLEQGYTVRIIYGDLVDQRPVHELTEHIRQTGNRGWQERLVVGQISSVGELFHELAQADLVVASRFHNVLCSLMLSLPVISLGYHEKNVDLMKAMGLEQYCQHIEAFTFEKLVEQFQTYLTSQEQVTARIQRQCEAYRRLLDEQYCQLFLPVTTARETPVS